MQLSCNQLQLIYILLSSLATAFGNPLGGLRTISSTSLNLIVTQPAKNVSANRVTYCKHDDDPYRFVSSLNYTFPDTPSLPQSIINSAGIVHDEGEYAFDCFFEIPGGVITFEIKGDIDSHLRLAFEVWMSILWFNYEIGVYSCDLLELEKDPCAFNIDKRYFTGQGGIYPKDDPDPQYVDLCLELHGVVKIPYTRKTGQVDFERCFYKFPRDGGPDKGLIAGAIR